jgi:hypothetical protein
MLALLQQDISHAARIAGAIGQSPKFLHTSRTPPYAESGIDEVLRRGAQSGHWEALAAQYPGLTDKKERSQLLLADSGSSAMVSESSSLPDEVSWVNELCETTPVTITSNVPLALAVVTTNTTSVGLTL